MILSLKRFIFEFIKYSRSSLCRLPFFVSLGLIVFFLSIQSCVIDCILHFFPCNLAVAHMGIQFNAVNTAISRKVVAKTVHATIPKGNMGYDQYTCPWHCSCRTYFCCFPLALANICPCRLVPFFEISLKISDLKATHNTFRGCRVHFFRQPFSTAEDLQIAAIFRHKGSYLVRRKLFCHCIAYKSVYYFISITKTA